jgi:hypothetical protein
MEAGNEYLLLSPLCALSWFNTSHEFINYSARTFQINEKVLSHASHDVITIHKRTKHRFPIQ